MVFIMYNWRIETPKNFRRKINQSIYTQYKFLVIFILIFDPVAAGTVCLFSHVYPAICLNSWVFCLKHHFIWEKH